MVSASMTIDGSKLMEFFEEEMMQKAMKESLIESQSKPSEAASSSAGPSGHGLESSDGKRKASDEEPEQDAKKHRVTGEFVLGNILNLCGGAGDNANGQGDFGQCIVQPGMSAFSSGRLLLY